MSRAKKVIDKLMSEQEIQGDPLPKSLKKLFPQGVVEVEHKGSQVEVVTEARIFNKKELSAISGHSKFFTMRPGGLSSDQEKARITFVFRGIKA